MGPFPIVVLHNVTSAKTCSDFVKIAAGFGYKTIIITNAQGSAAQRGIAAAQKEAIKNQLNFMVLSSIADVKELFNPDTVIVVTPPPYGKVNLDQDFHHGLEEKRWVVVFGGNDPGLSRKDLEQGDVTVQLPAGDIGSLGTLTLGLAILTGKFGFVR